jgi:hypothetical protein
MLAFWSSLFYQFLMAERVMASRLDSFSMLLFIELRRFLSRLRTEVYWVLDFCSFLFVVSDGTFYLLWKFCGYYRVFYPENESDFAKGLDFSFYAWLLMFFSIIFYIRASKFYFFWLSYKFFFFFPITWFVYWVTFDDELFRLLLESCSFSVKTVRELILDVFR